MAKKKDQAQQEQAQQTPETNGAAAEAEQVPEIPENVTLTREEFVEVKNRIDALQKEKDECVAMAQRLQADFDNYRKRNAAIRADSLEEGTRELIRSLLPVLDNFDRALELRKRGSGLGGRHQARAQAAHRHPAKKRSGRNSGGRGVQRRSARGRHAGGSGGQGERRDPRRFPKRI